MPVYLTDCGNLVLIQRSLWEVGQKVEMETMELFDFFFNLSFVFPCLYLFCIESMRNWVPLGKMPKTLRRFVAIH